MCGIGGELRLDGGAPDLALMGRMLNAWRGAVPITKASGRMGPCCSAIAGCR
jgi:hypothetical protein